MGISQEEPYVFQKFENNTISGIAEDMLGVLQEALGFDWEFVWTNQVGIKNDTTGKWNGLAKLILDEVNYCNLFPFLFYFN